MHVIVATTSLINLYLHELIEQLDGEYIIIEYSNMKIVEDRKLQIIDFVYNTFLEKLKKTKRLKKLIDALNGNGAIYYINHALNIIGNYISCKKNANVCIIPDGMLNYINSKAYNGTLKNLLNTKIFCIACGFIYKKPLNDVYNSGRKKYIFHYYLLRKDLKPAICKQLIEIKIKRKENFSIENATIILGQYCSSEMEKQYICHIKNIVRVEKSFNHNLIYKPHPFENLTIELTDFFQHYGVKIKSKKIAFESGQFNYSRIIGITSTALFTSKICGAPSTVVAYHKNLWKQEKDEYDQLLNVLKNSGIILSDLSVK